jgi:ribosomal protein S18 acetylase RimI-like enzyme
LTIANRIVRRAAADEAAELAQLIREAFRDVAQRFALTPQNCPKHPSNCTRAWIEADFDRGVQYFILEEDGARMGCVGLEHPKPEIWYLERLCIRPARRRRGLGRMLARHALARAAAGGAQQVGIGIIADQTELGDWYARIGFAPVRRQRFAHLPFEVLFMEMPLTPSTADG